MGNTGFIFGLLGFIFAASALARIRRLQQRLRDEGILKETPESGGER
jgi:hypothetical protein